MWLYAIIEKLKIEDPTKSKEVEYIIEHIIVTNSNFEKDDGKTMDIDWEINYGMLLNKQ